MRRLFACFVVLLCSSSSAQWVPTSCAGLSGSPSVSAIGTSLFAGISGTGIPGTPMWSGLLVRSIDDGVHWDTLATWPSGLLTPFSKRWELLCLVDSVLIAEVVGSGIGDRNKQHIVRSLDGGRVWVDTVETDWMSALFRLDSMVFAVTGRAIRVTANRGHSWDTVAASGLPSDFVSGVSVMGSQIFFSTPNYGVFRSSDQGRSWVPASNGLAWGVCGGLVGIGDTLYCQLDSITTNYDHVRTYVYRSTNEGNSWTDMSAGLSGVSYYSSSLWSAGEHLLCQTSSGLFRWHNLNEPWELWGQGLPAPEYPASGTMIAFSGTTAFAAIAGGVWKRSLSEIPTSTRQLVMPRPERYMLEQNYPNPFNPSTTIRYGLPSRSHVSLTVFNALGQKISVLQDGEQEAGYHEVRFDATNLSSGIYFYRLHAGEFVQTKRLVLVK